MQRARTVVRPAADVRRPAREHVLRQVPEQADHGWRLRWNSGRQLVRERLALGRLQVRGAPPLHE